MSKGNVIETEIANDVSEGTTIHWHGVPVPNAMDGVPNIIQPLISPGETFTYEFRTEPTGMYFLIGVGGVGISLSLIYWCFRKVGMVSIGWWHCLVLHLLGRRLSVESVVRSLAVVVA